MAVPSNFCRYRGLGLNQRPSSYDPSRPRKHNGTAQHRALCNSCGFGVFALSPEKDWSKVGLPQEAILLFLTSQMQINLCLVV